MEKLQSEYGVILEDQWDQGEFEKDIKTYMVVDHDKDNAEKPLYIELKDVNDQDTVIDSICIALSADQASALLRSLFYIMWDVNKGEIV